MAFSVALRWQLPLAATALLGSIASLLVLWAASGSSVLVRPESTAILRALIVEAYVLSGVYTWWRVRDGWIGPMVAGLGLLYALVTLDASANEWLHAAGRLVLAVFLVAIVYVLLCYPSSRLTPPMRVVAAVLAASTALAWIPALLLTEHLPPGGALADCGGRCPANPFRVASSGAAGDAASYLVTLVTIAGLAFMTVAVIHRSLREDRLRRRALGPLAAALVGLAASYSAFTITRQAGLHDASLLRATTAIAGLAIPFTIVAGQVYARAYAVAAFGVLLERAEAGTVDGARVQEFLREVLGDRTLRLAIWSTERGVYLDADGRPATAGAHARDVRVTLVPSGRLPGALLLHDPAIRDLSDILRTLVRASLVLLQNAALIERVRASRARITSAAQEERLRLERDLHDGAQQRLVNVQIKLADVRERAADDALAADIDGLQQDAAAALEELRRLAHGLYPTVLLQRGLPDALRAAVGPAEVAVLGGVGRYPAAVEAAVYFCALEAAQNAAKHAGDAAGVTVTLEDAGDELRFSVVDDGRGFDPADVPGETLGLTGMQDRIAAVRGVVEVRSSPGAGTTVEGRVPLAPSGAHDD